jgi:hypothetical protein
MAERRGGFRIVPLAEETAAAVRTTLKTPVWGYPASVGVAAGYGPCRTCLAMFEVGVDRCILFTHDEFAGREPYPLPGPVFVHAEPCSPYAEVGTFPAALRDLALTLNAYGDGRVLRAQVRLDDGRAARVEASIGRLLADSLVDYIHVRNTEVGCFLLEVRRPAEEAPDGP